jgi:phage terminase small subunit
MKDLLPDGGKVSVTVHSGPSTGGSVAPTVDPNTGVTLGAGQAPATVPTAVAAMRNVVPASAGAPANTSTAITPSGQTTAPNNNLAPPRTAPAVDPHASNSPDTWWNPYVGKFEKIPGIDPTGKVIDANAFWNYYTKYPAAGLDKVASGIAGGQDPGAWQHQYTPAEIIAMVTGNSDYQTQLGGVNNTRFQDLLNFGNITDEQAAAFGLTPDQIKAIRENPNSSLNTIRDALRTGTYEHAAGYAARGAYNSGARANDVGNLQTNAVKAQLGAQQKLNADLEVENQHVQQIFKDVKDAMETEGGFDPGDTDTNKAAWERTHKIVGDAQKTVTDFLVHVSNWNSLKTVTDMRGALNDARKAYAQFSKIINPADAGKLKAIIDGLTAKIHKTVMARAEANSRPVTGGGSAAGGGAYAPGKKPR